MKKSMTVYTREGGVAFVFYSFGREGNKIIIEGKALDAIRMDMVLTFDEILKGIKMALCRGITSFILLFPFFTFRFLFNKALRTFGRSG
jgi:hypothetical protein